MSISVSPTILLDTILCPLWSRQIFKGATIRYPVLNPMVRYWSQQLDINDDLRNVERNKFLPDITFTYFNTGFIGFQRVGNNDVFFGPKDRFSSFQIGASFPLWFIPQHGRTQSTGNQLRIAAERLDHAQLIIQKGFEQNILRLNKHQKILTYYETIALRNANLILEQAKKSFDSGEIGYLEYVQALKGTETIHMNYLEEVNQFNQVVIELEYLLGKK